MRSRDMIKLIGETTHLTKEDAYTLCSLAADLRVTQTINGSKSIRIMLKKSLLRAGTDDEPPSCRRGVRGGVSSELVGDKDLWLPIAMSPGACARSISLLRQPSGS
jgi:hypothetical protein